jgi:hypothetical protein
LTTTSPRGAPKTWNATEIANAQQEMIMSKSGKSVTRPTQPLKATSVGRPSKSNTDLKASNPKPVEWRGDKKGK